MKPILKRLNWKLTAILLLATLVRFGGLTWAFPYTPHPDEWNMARAIVQMNWADKLNPHFFAYGQFPLYLSYFSATFYNLIPWVKTKTINIPEAIFFLRFWSALAGTATIYLVYLISKKILTTHPHNPTHNPLPILTLTLAALTPGLIQISHFGTTESLLSFFFLLIIFLSFKILEKPLLKYFIFSGIVLGLALGTKISALVFGFPIFITFIMVITIIKFKNSADFFKFLGKYFLVLFLSLSFTIISSPYLVLAFKESRGTLLYETSIATGQNQVFYTRQFIDTQPILFQLQKIFPYTLGWPIFILGSLGFLSKIVILIKKILLRKRFLIFDLGFLSFIFSFLFYFMSQAFLFTKWTRFLAPIFVFFPILAGLFLSYLRNLRYLNNLLVTLAILPGIIFSSIYFFPDIRFTASGWIYQNIPTESKILYDTGNVVDIPLPRRSPSIRQGKVEPLPNYSLTSFDFYHLDENSELVPKLIDYLENSDYIIVPSRRIFSNHLRLLEKYPLTAKYYELLFSGKLGFSQVAKIEPFYSKIFKDEQAEETFSVFDHPTIRIYKKTVNLNRSQYETLFKN